jgi:hypothetical protein
MNYAIKVHLADLAQFAPAVVKVKIGAKEAGRKVVADMGDYDIDLQTSAIVAGKYTMYVVLEYGAKEKVIDQREVIIAPRTPFAIANARVFPVPAADMLTIEVKDSISKIREIHLFDLHGKEVKIAYTIAGNTKINIPLLDLPMGTYCLQLRSDDEVLNKRVVVSR